MIVPFVNNLCFCKLIHNHEGSATKVHKVYEADDKLIPIIADNYGILQGSRPFGISLGFGDRTVREVCEDGHVDTYIFLAIVSLTINRCRDIKNVEQLCTPTLIKYLSASHAYYFDFQLPFIRKELRSALDENDNLTQLITKIYDEYAHTIRNHMCYEGKDVFPYVNDLLNNRANESYNIETYSKHHGQADLKLKEPKNVVIKYLPSDSSRSNQLAATLYNFYNCEQWLSQHALAEDEIFTPAIRHLERQLRKDDMSVKISSMIDQTPQSQEALGDREKEVAIGLVQGMTNKEIAEHLCVFISTVITRRRSIARKLQIHSPAGLTIHVIVTNLVDISNVNL